jgi:hypothetical protein
MNTASKFVERRNLVSLANNTKWTEFFDEIIPMRLGFTFKFIDDDKEWAATWLISPAKHYIEGTNFGPVRFDMIEWVTSQDKSVIEQVAIKTGLFIDESGKIWGYSECT